MIHILCFVYTWHLNKYRITLCLQTVIPYILSSTLGILYPIMDYQYHSIVQTLYFSFKKWVGRQVPNDDSPNILSITSNKPNPQKLHTVIDAFVWFLVLEHDSVNNTIPMLMARSTRTMPRTRTWIMIQPRMTLLLI